MNALTLAAVASETGLDSHTWALIIGGGIFLAFMVGLLITVSYMNVGNRHVAQSEPHDVHRQTKVHERRH